MKIFLDSGKNYYKANLHCHTTYSDGRADAEVVKEEYKAKGYSAVAFTDHEHTIDCSGLTDDEFIALNGCELSISGPKVDTQSPLPSAKQTHICLIAKDPTNTLTPCYSSKYDYYKFKDVRHLVKHEGEYERVHSHEGISDIVRIAHEKGFLATYNHACWSLEDATDYLGYEGFDFVEIFNSGCARNGWYTDETVFANMLRAGKKVFCVAADDNHNIRGFEAPGSEAFGGWVMINASELSYGSLISALEAGEFYASTGPEIHSFYVDDEGYAHVTCSEAKAVHLLTQGRRTGLDFDKDGGKITKARFRLYDRDVSIRVKVDDGKGGFAYSQMYDLPEGLPLFSPPKK